MEILLLRGVADSDQTGPVCQIKIKMAQTLDFCPTFLVLQNTICLDGTTVHKLFSSSLHYEDERNSNLGRALFLQQIWIRFFLRRRIHSGSITLPLVPGQWTRENTKCRTTNGRKEHTLRTGSREGKSTPRTGSSWTGIIFLLRGKKST